MHPTIKFTADWSKTSINFLDVTVSITKGIIETDLYVKPTDSHQYLLTSSCHPFYCKRVYYIARHSGLTESVQIMSSLIKGAMT